MKWYFKTNVIVLGFLVFGPLVLPLVWFRPELRLRVRILASAAIVLLSILMGVMLAHSLRSISRYYNLLESL